MSYFLSQTPLTVGEITTLTGDEARHIILSRRMSIGEIIEIQDTNAKRFNAEVISMDKRSLSLQALEEIKTPKESKLDITIFQAMIKEQPLDFIIQKTTELGVDTLALFNSQNSVDRFKDMDKKIARWQRIGEEAAKQSGRVKPVKIVYLNNDDELTDMLANCNNIFLLEPNAKQKLSTWRPGPQVNKVGILVGPEGGFTEGEIREFMSAKSGSASGGKTVIPVSMGPRILRADTAAITSSAIVQSLWGDL